MRTAAGRRIETRQGEKRLPRPLRNATRCQLNAYLLLHEATFRKHWTNFFQAAVVPIPDSDKLNLVVSANGMNIIHPMAFIASLSTRYLPLSWLCGVCTNLEARWRAFVLSPRYINHKPRTISTTRVLDRLAQVGSLRLRRMGREKNNILIRVRSSLRWNGQNGRTWAYEYKTFLVHNCPGFQPICSLNLLRSLFLHFYNKQYLDNTQFIWYLDKIPITTFYYFCSLPTFVSWLSKSIESITSSPRQPN